MIISGLKHKTGVLFDKDIRDAVTQCRLFKGLRNSEAEVLLSECEHIIKSFSRNEFVINTGQKFPFIGMMISGCVEVQKPLITGGIVTISSKYPGDLFGGSVVFSRQKTFPCDIYAKEDSRIIFIYRHSMLEFIQKKPVIMKNLFHLFSESVMNFDRRLELFSYSSIKHKIIIYLLDTSSKTGSCTVHLPFSKTTWSQYLNVSRPSLCRELKALSDYGLVTIKGRNIKIHDINALETLLLQ